MGTPIHGASDRICPGIEGHAEIIGAGTFFVTGGAIAY